MVRAFKRMQELAANTLICKYIFLNPTKRIRVLFFFFVSCYFWPVQANLEEGKTATGCFKRLYWFGVV